MHIAITPRFLLAFAALIVLCGLGHEFVHHVTGAAVCGAFGYKTFNSFTLAASCADRPFATVLSTWAGPLFTYGLMWLGWHRLESPYAAVRQGGLALIFANFPVNRLFFALLGWNDEQYITRLVIGEDSIAYWLTNLAIWVLALPPLFAAWRALAKPKRFWWFTGLFLLPFAFVLVFGVVMETWLLLQLHFLAETVYGIPMLLVLTELVCLVVYLGLRDDLQGRPRAGEPGSIERLQRATVLAIGGASLGCSPSSAGDLAK
jgi:hypothetical protein